MGGPTLVPDHTMTVWCILPHDVQLTRYILVWGFQDSTCTQTLDVEATMHSPVPFVMYNNAQLL